MSDKRTIHLAGIDQVVLLPIIRQMTQRDGAALLDWQTQTLQGGLGDLGAGLVGVNRFTGQMCCWLCYQPQAVFR